MIMKIKKIFIIISVSVLLMIPGIAAFSQDHPIINLNDTQGRYLIGTDVEYFEDRSRTLDIEAILRDGNQAAPTLKWERSKIDYPSFGFSSSVFWFRFTIKDESDLRNKWRLVCDYPQIDNIVLYTVNEKGGYAVQKTGDRLPFSAREMIYRNFVFHLKSKPEGRVACYIRIETESAVVLPLWIMSESEIAKKIADEQFILGIYYGLLLIIAFYNFFVFLTIRDRSYLYYIIWIFGYGMYQITINGLSFQYFWPNSIWLANTSLPLFMFFGATAGLQFGRSFLKTRDNVPVLDRILLIIMSLTSLGVIFTFILPYAIVIRIGTSIVIIVVGTLLVAGIISFINGYRAARFYVIAWTALIVGISIFALKSFNLLPENFFTNWGQQIGSALEVTLLSIALADRINIINKERKAAMDEKMKAQEKFRLLFEGSKDMIFTLDEEWNFITMNTAIRNHLRLGPEEVISRNFLELIHVGSDGKQVTKKLIREKLEIFLLDRAPINFKTQFEFPYTQEPKEMHVWLELVSIGGRDEILGKATSAHEDTLIHYLEFEKQRFSIGNYFSTAEDISYRMTRNLVKFIEQKEINLLRIALREIIINAIEHGNLNVSFEEKTHALMNDNYFEIISERQRDPVLSSRKVDIVYSIDAEKTVYRITDEGDGFDYQKILDDHSKSVNAEMLSHGRGITMSKNIFDKIKYNEKGNQVLLIKRFNKNQQPAEN